MHLRNYHHTSERLHEVEDVALTLLYTPSSVGMIGQVFPRV